MTHAPSTEPGKIIFLTGVSSVGKTSVSTRLQSALFARGEPFLHVTLDGFIAMLPPGFTEAQFEQMVLGFHRSVAALCASGSSLIVDHVLLGEDWLDDCLALLRDCPVWFVGLDCPLEELERRESARDARRQGFARAQLPSIHRGKRYDLLLDTSKLSPDEAAAAVLQFYDREEPAAFQSLAEARLGVRRGVNSGARRLAPAPGFRARPSGGSPGRRSGR